MTGVVYGPAFAPIPTVTGKTFGVSYAQSGSNWKHVYGMGVAASLNVDATWRMAFMMSTVLPVGSPYLRIWRMANATAGTAFVNPKWAMCADGTDPSGVTLNSEGSLGLSWGAGDADKWMLTTVPLDAATVQGGKLLLLDLLFQSSGWTLTATSLWHAYVEFV